MRRTKRRLKRRRRKLIFILICSAILSFFILFGGMYLSSYLLGPPDLTSTQNTMYYSDTDDLIGEERGPQNRKWVKLDEISPYLVDATIAVEDKNFYTHHGFDLKRIGGAIISDIKHLSLKEGASTLTQQYAKNLYLSHEKKFSRKIKEAFYTVRLEMFYSKDEILEGYLNMIYYGHGAYGIETASNYFFDQHAKDLSLAEAAMLAGIPKGPTYYSPFNDKERAIERQKLILKLMVDDQFIDEKDYLQAKETTLVFAKTKEKGNIQLAPHFQDAVLKEAAQVLNTEPETVRASGMHIYTTLHKPIQMALEEKISDTIDPEKELEIGAIAMEPRSGRIQGLIGGKDYADSSFNRAITAKRMPGSTFKPFLYYAALENGYTASTMLMSKPTSFEMADGKLYKPGNFNGYYANEPITLAQALALSDNVYAVKTNMYLGVEHLVKTAQNLGIESKLPAVPSLALGTASVSVREMVTGYSVLANGGRKVEAYTIRKITDLNGKKLYERDDILQPQILDRSKAFILTDLMTGMFDRQLDGYMPVTGATVIDKLTHTYAGKSGSTNSDSWMIGYSPKLVTGVWTGYDDNRPIEAPEEMGYAKEVWANFMETAHKDQKNQPFSIPASVVAVEIDPETGKRATPYCQKSRIMYFEKGTEPQEACNTHFLGEKIIEEPEIEADNQKLKHWFDWLKEPKEQE